MKTLFTDLELLETIHKLYEKDYLNYDGLPSSNGKTNDLKNEVPIKLEDVASELKTDTNIIEHRLIQNLNNKYVYETREERVLLFYSNGSRINYPYLCAILAKLQDDNKKIENTFNVACFSLFVAIIALAL